MADGRRSDSSGARIIPVALCAECAHEAGKDHGAAELVTEPGWDGACQRCGAILTGFFYVLPEGSEPGMVPGAG